MTDKSSSAVNAWAQLWLDTQRKYWESWSDLSRKMRGEAREAAEAPAQENPEAPANPRDWSESWIAAQQKNWDSWFDLSRQTLESKTEAADEKAPVEPSSHLLDLWTRFWMPLIPGQSREAVSKLLDVNKAYFRMGEGLWRILSASHGAAQGAESQWDALSRGIRQMHEQFGEQLRSGKDPWSGFATFWGMPLDNWRRVCSAFSIMPGDMEKAVRGFGSPYGPETLHQGMVGVLSMPTLGYTREWQEELQRWGLLWLDHSQALQEYVLSLSGVTAKAIDLFGNELYERAQKGEPLESLRAFYNLWIDCSEQAYTDISTSDEFTRAQSQLTNTVFAVKRQEQKMVEEVLSAFNMPTRRELDTSHRRLHQLQRRVWQLEQTLEESSALELRAEVFALRRDLEALRGQVAVEKPEATVQPRKTKLKTPG
ncbi:class III poly(R)-hydroxyalkanoic acid synthase subunit PhaE [Methylocaldum sp.]|uniref:class III poly(R)-hydroxyalkanoic acid synthase subunit PhaE n=1 Tax=Methylocaldum sp. TaxID=1969727 RepID=UPI002D65D19D|nr:class III poly(R)-hydroxyalkanoic acid synthase subunit PhaE [Methylocaldum sp.]HYE37771.1 class III poly(R)-hydroxyalkanoic acid synthase subunit PhaE [Methylocaldum sp.]